jgi:hypothetical protein
MAAFIAGRRQPRPHRFGYRVLCAQLQRQLAQPALSLSEQVLAALVNRAPVALLGTAA